MAELCYERLITASGRQVKALLAAYLAAVRRTNRKWSSLYVTERYVFK
jgi:hypothetical protein